MIPPIHPTSRSIDVVLNADIFPEILFYSVALCRARLRARGVKNTDGVYTRGTYNWIYLTQVCSLWRDIALKTPSLWSFMDMRFPAAVKACIVRSKNRPLDVVLPIGVFFSQAEEVKRVFDEVMVHNRAYVRMRSLEVMVARPIEMPSLCLLGTLKNYPMLKTFGIYNLLIL
ncbi:hypothetical protein C8Q75DRAFT_609876 [Abortiporus biennis]|nr:hypothetical protein C8Q75DRAFT_609876 [Abortiporus biennis]